MNAVVKAKPEASLPVAAEDPSTAMVAMLERLAHSPDVDVDKLEKLMNLQERIINKQAEQSYNIAMSAAQTQMHPVSADATNPQTRSKYATYAALDNKLRPIYTRYGFALSFDTGKSEQPDHLLVKCHVTHKDGFSKIHQVDMPADGKGAKGGDVMTKTHAAGSAMSYGMRYLLKMIFNVAIGEYDDDGNGAGTDDSATADWLAAIDAAESMDALKEIADKLRKEMLSKRAMATIRAAWSAKSKTFGGKK